MQVRPPAVSGEIAPIRRPSAATIPQPSCLPLDGPRQDQSVSRAMIVHSLAASEVHGSSSGLLRHTCPPRWPLAQWGDRRLCTDDPSGDPDPWTQETDRPFGWAVGNPVCTQSRGERSMPSGPGRAHQDYVCVQAARARVICGSGRARPRIHAKGVAHRQRGRHETDSVPRLTFACRTPRRSSVGAPERCGESR
jgi:hypothetical protein